MNYIVAMYWQNTDGVERTELGSYDSFEQAYEAQRDVALTMSRPVVWIGKMIAVPRERVYRYAIEEKKQKGGK